MNAIFVGGPADGQWRVLPDKQTRVDVPEVGPVIFDFEEMLKPVAIRNHHYNLFRLHPVTRAVVFALDSLTPTQIMEKLLENYRPGDPLDRGKDLRT